MSVVAIALLFGLVAVGTALKGPRWAFIWLYLPILIVSPQGLELDVPGAPAITGRLAAALGLLLAAPLAKQRVRLLPAWRAFDALPVVTVISFAISFALGSDLAGFLHRVPVLTSDWLIPYLFSRVFLARRSDFVAALPALGATCALVAVVSLLEARLHIRFAYEFWHLVGGLPVPQWYIGGGARFGFLRAMGPFTHPITLGVFFATSTMLLLGWSSLEPQRRGLSAAAVTASLLGGFAALSRGPLLGLGLAWFFSKAVSWFRVRTVVLVTLLGLLVVSPLLIDATRELASSVSASLERTGNVENTAHYRFALFVVYLDELAHVGWFGNAGVVGRRYEHAWSIDNAYLYLMMVGGWLGGGLFLAMTALTLWIGTRSVAASAGRERSVRATSLGAFVALAVSMLDVWFCPDYAPLYFIVSAVVLNQASPQWGTQAVARRRPPVAPSPPPAPVEEVGDPSLARALRTRRGRELRRPGAARAGRPVDR
jgi:hypothetical protein